LAYVRIQETEMQRPKRIRTRIQTNSSKLKVLLEFNRSIDRSILRRRDYSFHAILHKLINKIIFEIKLKKIVIKFFTTAILYCKQS